MSLMPPSPPPRNRFVPGNRVVSNTDPNDIMRIIRVVKDSSVYETDRGSRLVANIDANYENVNVSGGKRKSRRNRTRKNKSRKNRRKTSHRRKKSSSRR
jgi:hypothetical protein